MISHPHKHFPTSCINSSGENPPDSATAVEYTGDYSGVEEVFAWQRQSKFPPLPPLQGRLPRAGPDSHFTEQGGGPPLKTLQHFFPAQIFPAMPFPEPPHTQLSAGTDTPNRREDQGGFTFPLQHRLIPEKSREHCKTCFPSAHPTGEQRAIE